MDGETSFHSVCTAARAVGCSERYVRYAETKGLIAPRRSKLGHRLLTEADVATLREAYAGSRRRGAAA